MMPRVSSAVCPSRRGEARTFSALCCCFTYCFWQFFPQPWVLSSTRAQALSRRRQCASLRTPVAHLPRLPAPPVCRPARSSRTGLRELQSWSVPLSDDTGFCCVSSPCPTAWELPPGSETGNPMAHLICLPSLGGRSPVLPALQCLETCFVQAAQFLGV